MSSITLILDESGAKGYADNREKSIGELGVVAGIILSTDKLQTTSQDVENIIQPYKIDGKLHITDLTSEKQESFRQEIFNYLESVDAKWVYEAMYVEGLYAHATQVKELNVKAKASGKSNIKISGNEDKHLLHSELFLGVFTKAVAFGVDNLGDDFHISVLTDQLDNSIVKAFQQGAKEFLNYGEPKETTVSGFDTMSKQIVRGQITSKIENYKEALCDLSGVTFDLATSNNPLTIVADVISNSVWYHLRQLQSDNPGCPLNTIEAISGYQLAPFVYGVSGQETQNSLVADTLFQYPHDMQVHSDKKP